MESTRGSNLLNNVRTISNYYNPQLANSSQTAVQAADDTLDTQQTYTAYTYAIQAARENSGYLEFSALDCESQERQLARYEIEWHRKFSLSMACLLLFFIGVPLGAIIRKGGLGIPLTVSILVFVVGYDIVTKKGGKVMTIDFVEGCSTTNIINKIKNL